MPSIGALKKSVDILASKLEAQGFRCQVDAVASGRGNTCPLSSFTSFVELWVYEGDNLLRVIKFLANGYGSATNGIIGGDSWTAMKNEALRRLGIESFFGVKR